MLRIKDIYTETEENVTFGTCELCEYTAELSWDVLIFEDDLGNEYEYSTKGFFDWGDYIEEPSIAAPIEFNEWMRINHSDANLNVEDKDAVIREYIDKFHELLNDIDDIILYASDFTAEDNIPVQTPTILRATFNRNGTDARRIVQELIDLAERHNRKLSVDTENGKWFVKITIPHDTGIDEKYCFII